MKRSTETTPFDMPRRGAPRKSSPMPLLAGVGVLAIGAVAFAMLRGGGNGGAPAAPEAAAVASTRVVKATPTPKPQPTAPPLPSWAPKSVTTAIPVAGKKVVALTFDDGPWPHSTNEILGILRDNNIKATFFMVGQEIGRRPEVAAQVRDAGHVIGAHSFTHAVRPRDPNGEISKTDVNLKKVLQFTPTIYRPPYGIVHNAMTRRAQTTNKAIILWSADSEDWRKPGVSRIVSNVLREVGPGGIILMHDGGGNRAETIAALPQIISGLRSRGYQFVTVPQLMAMRVEPTKAPPKKPAAKKKKKP